MIIVEQVYFDKVKDDTNILIKNNKNLVLTVRVANLDIIMESLVLAFFWKKISKNKRYQSRLYKRFFHLYKIFRDYSS